MKSYVNQLELSEEGNEVELGLVCINIRDSTTTNLLSIWWLDHTTCQNECLNELLADHEKSPPTSPKARDDSIHSF